jgi:transposase
VRYVPPLTTEQYEKLQDIINNDTSSRARSRAHSIILSSEGFPINDIAKIFHVDRDTISSWFTDWEQQSFAGLYDQPRSGRPPKLTAEEQGLALQYLAEEPRSCTRVVERLVTKTDKRISIATLKRLAKKVRLRWKRVRKSLKHLRDPEAFAQCQRELAALQHQEDEGKIDLYYFDESGFTLEPYIPYAWQAPGTVIQLPATKYARINVLGFMNRKNDLHPFLFEQSVNTSVVVACFDTFSACLTKKTVVIMDNASIHTSEEFEAHIPRWKKKGLHIKYLSEYSPELNLIEILWRTIKYHWLPFSAYHCLNSLIEALENILRNFGSEYQINFA